MAPPTLDPRLAALFGRVWPALPAGVARAGALGFSWRAVSTPFVRWEGGRAVAHVGLIELPLVIAGRPCRVGSIHAVCTDPDRRGGGLARALMEEALAAGRARYDTLVLTTLIPDFYAKLGFRPVREHAFSRALPRVTPSSSPSRALAETPDDVRLLRRLLERRAPVSERLGSLEAGTVFVIALLLTWGDFSRLHYHAELDALTVHEVRDRTLVLYDVVASSIPALEGLTAVVGAGADRVVTFFAPDRLGEGFHPEPWDAGRAAAGGDGWFAGLMALGPLAGEDGPLMLPPLSRT
ncbi:MAG TPA: GNAT family N-acetyltransferase [Methylomirabilota bacterium]|nr:GNAT family N-acetyltransferase [Methylomirabilota bacterium]